MCHGKLFYQFIAYYWEHNSSLEWDQLLRSSMVEIGRYQTIVEQAKKKNVEN